MLSWRWSYFYLQQCDLRAGCLDISRQRLLELVLPARLAQSRAQGLHLVLLQVPWWVLHLCQLQPSVDSSLQGAAKLPCQSFCWVLCMLNCFALSFGAGAVQRAPWDLSRELLWSPRLCLPRGPVLISFWLSFAWMDCRFPALVPVKSAFWAGCGNGCPALELLSRFSVARHHGCPLRIFVSCQFETGPLHIFCFMSI